MAQLQYDNFDLQILPASSNYEARILKSPAGEGKCSFAVPFTPEELERLGPYPSRNSREIELGERLEYRKQNYEAFGQKLFQAVFSDEVRRLFDRSLATVKGEDKGLRILLRLDAVPELARWPWEYLFDPTDGFLQFNRPTPVVIVRYSEVGKEAKPLAVSPPLKILVVISKPSDARVLDVEGEWTKLKEALGNLETKGQVQLERLGEATLSNLRQKIRTFQPHALHYIGHGTFDDEGSLVLEKEDGSSDVVSGQELLVQLGTSPLRLVILNACQGAKASETDPYVGIAQRLLKGGIPAVIAMQYAIGDAAAKTFASEFYTALADSSYPIDAALTEARRALFESDRMEWGTPVLFMRSPDSRIFDLDTLQDVPEMLSQAETLANPEPYVNLLDKFISNQKSNVRFHSNLTLAILLAGIVLGLLLVFLLPESSKLLGGLGSIAISAFSLVPGKNIGGKKDKVMALEFLKSQFENSKGADIKPLVGQFNKLLERSLGV